MTTRASGKSARQDITETLWPRAAAKEDGLPPLLILLTIVTSVVDALAYLRLGHVFVANMTGNVVFLGFAAAGAGGLSVPGSLLAIAFFLCGGVAAGAIRRPSQRRTAPAAQHRGHRRGRSVRGGDRGRRYCRPAPRNRQPLRPDRLLALAMGIQNATARRGALVGALLLFHVAPVAPLVLAVALLALVAVGARRRGTLVT
jgi:Protein of unknown function (DUF1275)